MKIAVTGGCGFIGSHTVDLLLRNGHDVIVYDDLSTGSPENLGSGSRSVYGDLSTGILEDLGAGAKLYVGDITDRTELDAFFTQVRPEAVMHMAAQIDVQASMNNPSFDANVNIMGTVNILDMCNKHEVKRFVYSSSAAVYGIPEYLGIDENHPKNPESFYGYSKLVPETYIRKMSESCDMTYGIIRYANVYGPRQRAEGEGGVVAIFTNRMIKNRDCIIYGDGEQTRDFIYVKDIARANVLALESKMNFTANASTSVATSVNELFNVIKKRYGYRNKPIYKNAREGDVVHSWLTNDRIMQILEWNPEFDLKAGINDMAGVK